MSINPEPFDSSHISRLRAQQALDRALADPAYRARLPGALAGRHVVHDEVVFHHLLPPERTALVEDLAEALRRRYARLDLPDVMDYARLERRWEDL